MCENYQYYDAHCAVNKENVDVSSKQYDGICYAVCGGHVLRENLSPKSHEYSVVNY